MIDIHTHILYNFDDGADTPEMSLLMCAAALEADTRAMIATPHFTEDIYEKTSKEKVYEEVERLNSILLRNKTAITVYPGCEAYISPDLPKLLVSGKCATMNGSRYLLVELPMYSIPLYTHEVLFELQIQGIIPILAHPERYSEIIYEPKRIKSFINKGVLVQINAGSITGRMGKIIQKTAQELLSLRAVQFVSSDAHNLDTRKPDMKRAYNMVMKKYGKENADILFKVNPENIIKDESIQEMIFFRRNPLKKIVRAYK